MIRVVVSYPNQPGSRFDLDYYLTKHMPMVDQKFGPFGLSSATADQGIAGGTPGSSAQYQMQAMLMFPTIEQMQAAMAAAGAEVMADISNFTDIRAEIQINRVLR
jgi:uncharacterized protein (TIGR02118 family)